MPLIAARKRRGPLWHHSRRFGRVWCRVRYGRNVGSSPAGVAVVCHERPILTPTSSYRTSINGGPISRNHSRWISSRPHHQVQHARTWGCDPATGAWRGQPELSGQNPRL